MGDVLKNKKEKISCFESHFLRDQDFSTSKEKKKMESNEMSISQPVTFTLQSKIIFKHGWLL